MNTLFCTSNVFLSGYVPKLVPHKCTLSSFLFWSGTHDIGRHRFQPWTSCEWTPRVDILSGVRMFTGSQPPRFENELRDRYFPWNRSDSGSFARNHVLNRGVVTKVIALARFRLVPSQAFVRLDLGVGFPAGSGSRTCAVFAASDVIRIGRNLLSTWTNSFVFFCFCSGPLLAPTFV